MSDYGPRRNPDEWKLWLALAAVGLFLYFGGLFTGMFWMKEFLLK